MMSKRKSRARKTSTVPTRIYSYRCLPPITESARVEDQYRLAAQYRNALVEIEHKLRERIREVQLAHTTIGSALRNFESAQVAVDAAYAELREAKSGVAEPDLTGPRERLTAAKKQRDQDSDALREAKRGSVELGKLKVAASMAAESMEDVLGAEAARAAYEELRTQRPDDDALLEAYAAAREATAKQRVVCRADYSARGLRHGAYTRVEDAVRQAAASTRRPLRFERYDGSGVIGTQLTARKKAGASAEETEPVRGLTWLELVSATDARIRLAAPGAADAHPRRELDGLSWEQVSALPRNLRRHAARTWVDLRVGSNADRSPIFARFPVTLHRPLPKDSVIKWAHVVRRRIGHRKEWRLQLTLESKMFERPPVAIGRGTCAINLGWRRLVDDQGDVIGLRAAYVVDQDGNEREIRVPDYVPSHGEVATRPALAAIGKCDDLARIRDQALERAQFALSVWLAERGGVPPEWQGSEPVRADGTSARPMAERLRGYSAWRAAWKLHRFVDAWKSRRVPGDDQIFASLMAWAKQDRHLETWQVSSRDRLIARRREVWRVVAAELARQYATILVGESKLTEIDGWERAAPEDGDPADGRVQRRMSRIAAPGELLTEIKKAAAKTGAEVRLCAEKLATQTCASCGSDEHWDAIPNVAHQCASCGVTWDQDANHCRNLLAFEGFTSGANGGGRSPGAEPLARRNGAKKMKNVDSAAGVAHVNSHG
jgi:hypothetical protein